MSYLSRCLPFLTGVIAAGMFTQSCIKSTSPEDIAAEIGGGYTVVAKLEPTGYAQDVIVVDSCAYIAEGQGGFGIVSVKDPEHPILLSELLYETAGYARKLAYFKDSDGTEIIYCADGSYGVASIDVTDKIHPRVPKKNNGYRPAISFCIFRKFLLTAVNGNGIAIVPFNDPKFPLVSDPPTGFKVPGYCKGVCISADSGYALLACGEGGFNILNLSHWVTHTKIPDGVSGRLDLPGSAEYIVNIPGTKYACIACGPAGLQIIDYADTAHIKLVGSFATGGFAKDVCVAGSRAYLATELHGVQIIDIEDVTTPKLIGKVQTSDARGIDVSNGYVYVTDQYQGLIIIKIP